MRVITWNLFHGRSVPDTPRSLLEEFGSTLAAWEWDVALLQEVPPWWPGPLARVSGASNGKLGLLSELVDRYAELVRDQSTVDQYIEYNRFWQRSIAESRSRYSPA